MERIVEIEPLERYLALGEHALHARQRRFASREGDAARAVDAGDGDGFLASQRAQDLRCDRLTRADGGHLSLASGLPLQLTAVINHLHRLFQGQRAARPRGRDLANAMTGCGTWHQPLRTQHFRHAHLIGEQCRLRNLGLGISARAIPAGELVLKRKIGEFREDRVDRLHRRFEYRILIEQSLAHALPLRSVSGIHERDGDGRFQRGRCFDRDFRFGALDVMLQCRRQRTVR